MRNRPHPSEPISEVKGSMSASSKGGLSDDLVLSPQGRAGSSKCHIRALDCKGLRRIEWLSSIRRAGIRGAQACVLAPKTDATSPYCVILAHEVSDIKHIFHGFALCKLRCLPCADGDLVRYLGSERILAGDTTLAFLTGCIQVRALPRDRRLLGRLLINPTLADSHLIR